MTATVLRVSVRFFKWFPCDHQSATGNSERFYNPLIKSCFAGPNYFENAWLVVGSRLFLRNLRLTDAEHLANAFPFKKHTVLHVQGKNQKKTRLYPLTVVITVTVMQNTRM